ncbi:uncharacterized protein LOC126911247 [Spodoptera frugiperda]|uniref:Uncharacterized protein LOC126911247 n=1 Tax=Spodoptera frugiperda TaxID=7108 RepID=A0A9R0DUI8_SPOFR|nr:uncharacterized protein LOC126911247 [Spodoptera frugiperda]
MRDYGCGIREIRGTEKSVHATSRVPPKSLLRKEIKDFVTSNDYEEADQKDYIYTLSITPSTIPCYQFQILLLLLVAAAVQCHSSHHGRSHGRYHRPNDYHRRHDSREKHRHHNYHDSPDSFEDSSKDLEDDVNPSRTPRSELENFVVDLKPIDNPVTDSDLTGNKSAMDTEVDKKANDMDKGYSGIKVDDITSDDAGPSNLEGDTNATNVNGMSLNSNDMPKSDETISGNGFSPNEGGNVGNNLESNLGADSGNHKFGGNTGVNLGGNLGLPLVNKPGLRLGGNFGVPFSGNLGVNLGSYPRFPLGVPFNDKFGINLGRNLGFPTFGIKDFRSIPYLHLGGNRGLGGGGNQGFPLGDNSGLHLGGNSDRYLGENLNGNIGGHNLGADSLSINSRSSLEDLIDNNEKNILNVDSDDNHQLKDVDNLEQTSKTIDGIQQNTNDNVGSDGHEPAKLDGDYHNIELKSNDTDVRGLSLESERNNTNDWVNKAEGESPSNHEDLNGDNLGSDNYNDTDKEKPVIDTHSSNIDEILISPEHDIIENTRPMSTDDHLSEIPSIKTPDKTNNKEDDGDNNQFEMIPVLLPGGGYVLLPSSILSDMPSYIVVMINGQPTLLQNPSYDINDGPLDLSKLILANGLSVSGAVLPSWYNLGAPTGDDGATIGASPDGPRPASPIWVGGSDATISPLTNPYSESIPVIDSIPRPVPNLPISVPGMIDPGFSPSHWNTGFSNNNHNLQNPGSYVDWGNQIDPDKNVDANIANPTSTLPTYPYPQNPYPYLHPPSFNSNYPTTYPSANNNNYSGKNGPIDDNNDTSHPQVVNPNDMSSSDPRKPYPNYSLNPRPDTHINVSEGKPPKERYELHPQPQTGPDGKSHLYTHPFYPQNDFHEPNPDISIESGHRDDERNELHPDNWDDKSIERGRLDLWDDLKSESSQEDRDDVKVIDAHSDHQHGKWTKHHPNLQDNNRKENAPDHRDDIWNKLHPNQWHDKSIEPHPDDRDDKKIESHLGYKDDKRIEPQSNHWDDKKVQSHPQLTDDERIKFHTDDWDNKWIEPHSNDRNDKKFEPRPDHWDDKTIKPHPDDWEDERIEQHPNHWEDKKYEPHPDHWDDKKIELSPQHYWGDKRIESHHNQWDGKRFESHPDHWDDKSVDSNPEDWEDKRIEPHTDHWDGEKIKSHSDHWDKDEKRTYPHPDVNIPHDHQPESQTDDLTLTHSVNLPNIPFHPEQDHGIPHPDIPGFHFTLPRPTNVDKSEKNSLVNGLIDSLNILLKYPNRDGNESKEVRSLIKLLLAILKPGDRNQMLVPKLNDDVENELDLANVNHLLLHLLSGYYEPNLKLLLDPSLDESTRTNLILLLKLLVKNQDPSPPKGTENPLLYFLGQFPCDLSKKREESEALSSKLLQLLAENSDRGDLHTRLERTVALVSQ